MKHSTVIKNWDSPDYQKITGASLQSEKLRVEFGNGDVALVPLNSVLHSKEAISSEQVFHNPYEVIIEVNAKQTEIPWDTIRAITDKEYSKFLSEEAEQEAKLVGVKIRRLREQRNLKANELSEISGVTPQTISRIEKGHTDVSFGTLKKLLGAMGYSLKDLAQQEELELEESSKSVERLFKKLARAGIENNFLLTRIIPKHLSNSLATISNHSNLFLDELTRYLKRVYNWTEEQIWNSDSLTIDDSAFKVAYYKTPSKVNINQIKAYSHYAYYLSKVVLHAFPKINVQKDYPGDIDEFKDNYYLKYKELSFEDVLNYVWDLGICVLPLNDPGVFHGASWNIDGHHVIVLKQTNLSHSRWIFDLLHELYHVFADLDEPNSSVIELEELTPTLDNDSQVELEANTFANQVIFDKKAEELAMRCIETASYKLENLKGAVKQVAKQQKIREDFLSNYMAFRLQLQNENWWGTATKMQVTDPSPFIIASDILKERLSIGKLNPIDANLLLMAINN
jgi:transcriptional regulator with XRE-family HTH domain